MFSILKLFIIFTILTAVFGIVGVKHASAVCNSTLNINEDGEYGFTGGASADFSISLLANGATSGAIVDKGSYYLLDTSKFSNEGDVTLTWQLNNVSSETFAYYGYEVRSTVDNGYADYTTDAGGHVNNEGTYIKCADVYSTIASSGAAHYGENWNCDNATCANVAHSYSFDPREYSGKILKFSVTEKFNQATGGTSIYDNFIRYIKPILVDVPDPNMEYYLRALWKDRANDIDTSSSCGTYCENRNGTYFLKNGEVYIETSFITDESGNLQPMLTANSRLIPWQSSTDGANWTDNATLVRVPTAEGGEINFEGINTNGQDYYNNTITNPTRVRSITSKSSWLIRKKGTLDRNDISNYDDYNLTVNSLSLESNPISLAVNLPSISYDPDIVLTDNGKIAYVTVKNSNAESYPADFKVQTGKYFNVDGPTYTNYYTDAGETKPDWLNNPTPLLDNLTVNRVGQAIKFELSNIPATNQEIYSSINSAVAFPELDSEGKIDCKDSNIEQMVNNSLQGYINGTVNENYIVSQAKANDVEAISFQCDVNSSVNPCSYARTKISFNNSILPTCTLKANGENPLKISKGSSVNLSWDTTNAESIQVNNGVGVVGPVSSGLIPLGIINGTVQFTMTATNNSGSSTCSVLINLIPEPTCSMTAPCVKKDSEFDLSYSTSNADSATIEPNSVFAEVGTNKSVHISNKITNQTTYTMTAKNASGTGTCSVDVVPQDSCTTRNLQGIFIAGKIDDKTGDSNTVTISQDSHVINNPPPGFNDLFAPLWQELVP